MCSTSGLDRLLEQRVDLALERAQAGLERGGGGVVARELRAEVGSIPAALSSEIWSPRGSVMITAA